MMLEEFLPKINPSTWKVRQVVIFDWYDGPREGVAWLADPPCEFFFKLRSERYTPDDLDDRLFLLSELPAGSAAKILTAIRPLGEPLDSVWIPVWQFATDGDRRVADQEIDRLLARKTDTHVVVRTRDMKEFLGCWVIDEDSMQQTDWFETLRIA